VDRNPGVISSTLLVLSNMEKNWFRALCLGFPTGETGDTGADLHFPVLCHAVASVGHHCMGFEDDSKLSEDCSGL